MINFNDISMDEISSSYDVGIFCKGFESRCSSVYSSLSNSVVFNKIIIFDFQCSNTTIFDRLDPDPSIIPFERVEDVKILLKDEFEEGGSALIDYSSMNREMIACVISFFDNDANNKEHRFTCDFLYAHAKFSPPPEEYGPISYNSYISPYFVGENLSGAMPTSCILGIGYERDIALGVVEDLEASQVILFQPIGHDSRYTDAIVVTNRGLMASVESLIEYDVRSPQGLYNKLCSAVKGLQIDTQPVVVPLGPKIFAMVTLIACCALGRTFSVWRIAAIRKPDLNTHDREFNGIISASRVVWDEVKTTQLDTRSSN